MAKDRGAKCFLVFLVLARRLFMDCHRHTDFGAKTRRACV